MLEKITLEDTHAFSSFFLDYIRGKDQLKPFYHRFPVPENFAAQIADKADSYLETSRKVLVESLKRQYAGIPPVEAVQANLEKLSLPTTFTVTTGHQLNLFTGPLYFLYKIITVINACRDLKAAYPDYDFVPVYWMASEDHDFEEINHFRLGGETLTWQTNQTGAVGRFDPSSLSALLDQIPADVTLFREAYITQKTLAGAVRHYVNALFGNDGLVVVDGDDHDLKMLFREVIADDLVNQKAKNHVERTNTELHGLGYKTQIHAREINLFYLDKDIRQRIELDPDGRYHVVGTDLSFSQAEILDLVNREPEKFSPNVALRPLYQEVVLPNLAYTGGPAETIYWLQLKSVFDHYRVPFPILLPRNFVLLVDTGTSQKIKKAGLTVKEVFLPKDSLINTYTLKHSEHGLKLNGEKEAIERYFNVIRENVEAVDKSLGPMVGAEAHKTMKSLEKIEQKLLKAEKRFLADKLAVVESIKDRLFPGGTPQERADNVLNFMPDHPDIISTLIKNLEPFDFKFSVLIFGD